MSEYKYLSMEYGSIRSEFCNIHRSSGTLPAMRMHYHDFYQIYFITKGQMLHRTPEQQCALYSGDCFVIPPHFPHSIGKEEKEVEFYAFSFRPDFPDAAALGILPQLQSPETLRLKLSLSPEEIRMLEQLMDCSLQEFQQQLQGWDTAVKGMLQTMLVLFSRAYAEKYPVLETQSAILESIRYIDHHFREEIRLEELLNRFHFSPSGFYRGFQQMTGKSFHKYLTQKRMEHAAFLLRSTDLPLQTVADRCGYRDYSAFYRAFQKYVGLRPSQYPRAKEEEQDLRKPSRYYQENLTKKA